MKHFPYFWTGLLLGILVTHLIERHEPDQPYALLEAVRIAASCMMVYGFFSWVVRGATRIAKNEWDSGQEDLAPPKPRKLYYKQPQYDYEMQLQRGSKVSDTGIDLGIND